MKSFCIHDTKACLSNNNNNNNDNNNNNNVNNNNNNNKIFITVSMYLAHRANWGHLLLQN